MPSWFRWISFVQPLSYAFEAVMVRTPDPAARANNDRVVQANQFSRIDLPCSAQQIVPNIPGADPAFQTCYLQGATSGSLTVSGANYISTSFGYSYANVWRNFAIVIAFTIGASRT
jgi:ABC-type multidrug transport system permease subunit